MGNLTTYFNVPGIFGSTPYQVRNYIGVDCADVLMAAYCMTKNIPLTKDYNVAMLVSKFKHVVKFKIKNGKLSKIIRWYNDVMPGDFIAVKYFGSYQYQHIGVLYSDVNKDWILDSKDLILQVGPDPLHYSPLTDGFEGDIVILRPD